MFNCSHLFKRSTQIICLNRSLKNFLPKKTYQNKIKYDEVEPAPHLDGKLLSHLQQISLLKFTEKDIENLKEDIFLANAIFQCKDKTRDVEPLYSTINEIKNCPTREDMPDQCERKLILGNTRNTSDDYFVSPEPNKPLDNINP
uniref:Glutamyl-tRNA(Gln) amidotransferase subunit F, mitochondrial n=1 Tax=Strongyloides papillosus TaxID=174720 RepID=A0A0N5CDG5_STREA